MFCYVTCRIMCSSTSCSFLARIIACLVGEGGPTLRRNTKKFSFLFWGPSPISYYPTSYHGWLSMNGICSGRPSRRSMRRGWKKLLCLIGLHVLYIGEGRPALWRNTKKFSFLVFEPFSSRQLRGNFSSLAVHGCRNCVGTVGNAEPV